MKAKIIDITSASTVKVKADSATVIVLSNEFLRLKPTEVGFLEGKRKHHWQGVFMQGGIINPGWEGVLTIEFLITGEIDIKKGDKIAHAIILEADGEIKIE